MKNTVTLQIDNNSRENAKILSVKAATEEIRKRIYVLATGAFALTKYLKSEGYNASCKQSLFKIPSFVENIEIADIYLGSARIDVRVTFDEKKFYIPKSHKKYSVLPNFYFVLSSNSSLTEMKILGFVTNAELNEEVSAGEYYEYETKILKPVKVLEKSFSSVELRDESFSQNDHKKISELAASFFDNEISESEKIFFIKHLLGCTICRERICEFSEFDTIIAQTKNYPELFDDQTLNILAGIESTPEEVSDFLESEISPSVLDMVKDTNDTINSIESTNLSADIESLPEADLEENSTILDDLTDSNQEESTQQEENDESDEQIENDIQNDNPEIPEDGVAAENEEDNLQLNENDRSEESEFDTLQGIEDTESVELLETESEENDMPEEDSLSQMTQEFEEQEEETLAPQEQFGNEMNLSDMSDETETETEIETNTNSTSLDELVSEPIIDQNSEEEENTNSDELTKEDDSELLSEENESAQEIHTSLDDLESEIIEDGTEPFSNIEQNENEPENSDSIPAEQEDKSTDSYEIDNLTEISSEENVDTIQEIGETNDFEEVNELELTETTDDLLLEAEDEPLELFEEEIPDESMNTVNSEQKQVVQEPETSDSEIEPEENTFETEPVADEITPESENELEQTSEILSDEDLISTNSFENLEANSSIQEEDLNEIEEMSETEPEEMFIEEAEQEESASELNIENTDTKEFENIRQENNSQMYENTSVEQKLPKESQPKETLQEEEIEYSGIELIDEDDLPSELPPKAEENSQLNDEIQDLLDEELISLLSDDSTESIDTNPANSSTSTTTEQDSKAENDDSIGALFENDDTGLDETGETTLDLSEEPAAKSAAGLTKKIITAALLLLLIAAGGVTAFYLKFNKSNDSQLPDMNAPSQDNSPFDEAANMAGTTPENEPPMAQDINKSMTNVFSEQPAAITITKISWEVSQKLASDETFKNYLQIAGKNLQMNLQNDLAYTTDFNYNNNIKVSFEIGKDNAIKRIQVTESSGSEQIDNVVLQSIKETLKYINVPNIKGHEGNYNLSIQINF